MQYTIMLTPTHAGLSLVIVVPVAAVAGLLLVLVVAALALILYSRRKKLKRNGKSGAH